MKVILTGNSERPLTGIKFVADEKGPTMNFEIHNPELVQRVNAHIQTGHFHDADELLEKALDALKERAAATEVPAMETGSVILAALRASPYREIDLTPPRVLLGNARDIVVAGH